MTPAQALEALHRAGRIRGYWLPGMVVRRTLTPGGPVRSYRLSEGRDIPEPWSEVEIVAGDPATVGCLLALVEEALGRRVSVRWSTCCEGRTCGLYRHASDARGKALGRGPSLGEAAAAALAALAGGGA